MAKKLTYLYDSTADELNITLGKARAAVAIELENEIFLQLNPKTKEIVGITVPFFNQRLAKGVSDMASIPFSGVLVAKV